MVSRGKEERTDERGRGISTIMLAFKGEPSFVGLYDEDLETVAENDDETVNSCRATNFEKRKGMFVMLAVSVRTLLNGKARGCITFEEGREILRS